MSDFKPSWQKTLLQDAMALAKKTLDFLSLDHASIKGHEELKQACYKITDTYTANPAHRHDDGAFFIDTGQDHIDVCILDEILWVDEMGLCFPPNSYSTDPRLSFRGRRFIRAADVLDDPRLPAGYKKVVETWAANRHLII